jgi:hypothetical protein
MPNSQRLLSKYVNFCRPISHCGWPVISLTACSYDLSFHLQLTPMTCHFTYSLLLWPVISLTAYFCDLSFHLELTPVTCHFTYSLLLWPVISFTVYSCDLSFHLQLTPVTCHFTYNLLLTIWNVWMPIPFAVRSKASFCCHANADMAGLSVP